jgi:hypothetical protein
MGGKVIVLQRELASLGGKVNVLQREFALMHK